MRKKHCILKCNFYNKSSVYKNTVCCSKANSITNMLIVAEGYAWEFRFSEMERMTYCLQTVTSVVKHQNSSDFLFLH